MAVDGFLSALATVVYGLFLIGAVFIYISLVRQIRARGPETEAIPIRHFGLPEVVLAVLLAGWFLLGVVASAVASRKVTSMHNRDLLVSALFTIGLAFFIAAFLRLRGLNLTSLAGFAKIGFGRAVATGAVLLLAAYPLVLVASAVTQSLLRGVSDKQGIVELFNSSSTLDQRVLIILLAVAIAPIAEEFFFRFFLYGVMKQYFGAGLGALVSALLFAAVHAHLPSFAPLFVLGICFTIAYEWTGSLLVSMTMHALFNSLALVALAFPDTFPQ